MKLYSFLFLLIFSLLIGCDNKYEVLLEGNNDCYMIQAYFPTETLNDMLPNHLTIPDAATMQTHYPDTELKDGEHPFLASFSHGSNIHDIITKQNVPEQEEIMFLFPVIYTHDDGTEYLCSYSPVLYLDSFMGVIGGLFYGLRKEYHPDMEHGEYSTTSKWWSLEGIFDASFEQIGEDEEQLPKFFEQIFSAPNVTLSYPQPFETMIFYQSKVYPNIVRKASETFYWNYKETTVQHGEDTLSVYANYFFTMSKPMSGKNYFETDREQPAN